jgi:hypothetical protein
MVALARSEAAKPPTPFVYRNPRNIPRAVPKPAARFPFSQ